MGDEELAARAQEERERAQRTAEAERPPGVHGRELELKRVPGDRRLYAMEGVGTLRLAGFGPATAATAGGSFWIAGRGFWGVVIQATDAAGTAVGEFRPSRLRRGGALRWADLELTLRRAGFWRQRYVLAGFVPDAAGPEPEAGHA